jgi:hypothetical protein
MQDIAQQQCHKNTVWTETQVNSEDNETCIKWTYSGKAPYNQSHVQRARNINIRRTIIIKKLIGNVHQYCKMHVL